MAFDETWDRRQFTRASVLALLSGVAITVSDCSSYGGSPTSPSGGGDGNSGDEEGVISANHGHRAVITDVQLKAGNGVTLDIQGTANHPHTVELTAQQIQAIADGQRVSQLSSTDQAHSHTVTFN